MRAKLALVVLLSLQFIFFPVEAASKKPKSVANPLLVWASTGPLAYLQNARISLLDASGRKIATTKTNHRGTTYFALPKHVRFPLTILTAGGRAQGKAFRGHLAAQVDSVDHNHRFVFLDLISTTAQKMTKSTPYKEAVARVRWTLGIPPRAMVDTLRVKNPYVEIGQLNRAVEGAGGWNPFVDKLAVVASGGQRYLTLKPSVAMPFSLQKSLRSNILNRALAADADSNSNFSTTLSTASTTPSSSYPQSLCTTSTSTVNTVAEYGELATTGLLSVLGDVDAEVVSGVTGMMFATLGATNASPTDVALDNIASQLDCIQSEVNAIIDLEGDIVQLENENLFQTDLATAKTCQTQLGNAWNYYLNVANTNSLYQPVTKSNPNICGSTKYSPQCLSSSVIGMLNSAVQSCGSGINDALFGTAGEGSSGSAWAQLNTIYQGTLSGQSGYAWYTSTQNQALQSFLSYWGTLLYYQFVMSNEVFNIYGQFAEAVTSSGGPGTGASACAYGQTQGDPTYCVWQNNIAYAFPGNLYSDEIGLWSTGLAVNAFPGGLTMGTGATGFTANYLANTYWQQGGLNNWSYNYSPQTLAANAVSSFNAQGVNPANSGSIVETYSAPQALRTTTISSSMIAPLTGPQQPQVTGVVTTASSFFFNALNQTGAFNGASAPSIGYYTTDNISKISGSYTNNGFQTFETVTVTPNSFIAGTYPSVNPVFTCYSGAQTCFPGSTGSTGPVLAVLMGRTYWASAANATNGAFYSTLPAPPTVPASPVLTGVSSGPGQILVSFTPLNSSQSGTSASGGAATITGYLASCSTGGGTPFTASGQTSPITVMGLKDGVAYTCGVQAQNAGGLGMPSACPTVGCSATPMAANVPSAPTSLVATAGYLQVSLAFNPPISSGGSAITGYQANCGSGTTTVSGVSSPLVVTNLTAGATYTCSVTAQNAVGTGPAATTTAVVPLAASPPGAPVLTAITNLNSNNTAFINLTVTPPSSTGGVPLTQYTASCWSTNAPIQINLTGTQSVSAGNQVLVTGGSSSGGYTYSCSVTVTNSSNVTSSASNVMSAAAVSISY